MLTNMTKSGTVKTSKKWGAEFKTNFHNMIYLVVKYVAYNVIHSGRKEYQVKTSHHIGLNLAVKETC